VNPGWYWFGACVLVSVAAGIFAYRGKVERPHDKEDDE
jgi:hypothetical protein